METLKELRTSRKLLQKDVAASIGVDRTTYVKYESGASEPPVAMLVRLADIFGVTVDQLVGHEAKHQTDNSDITQHEKSLLAAYWRASDEVKDIVCHALRVDPEQGEKRNNAAG